MVCPVYGSPSTIPLLCERLHESLTKITANYEIILVFDCSPDNGWEFIRIECAKHKNVVGIRLSRNFGQHYAITAGLKTAKGEWIVVMDCDLQDQPEEIEKLYARAIKGADIVLARRTNRKDHVLKRLSSKCFYRLFSYMTNSEQDPGIANFGIYHRKPINAILSMGDKVRFFPTMAQWVGFERTTVEVEHSKRQEGKSTYSYKKLIHLAIDTIISFSDKPLTLSVYLGMTTSFGSSIVSAYYLFRYFSGGIKVSGFTTLILSIWFLSGIIIFLLGMLGVYIGRSFEQVKNRPTYIIRDTLNLE